MYKPLIILFIIRLYALFNVFTKFLCFHMDIEEKERKKLRSIKENVMGQKPQN